jgi:biopolymer transport protein ExbB
MIQLILAAGWPAWPLLLASVVALALIIERFFTLRANKVIPDGLYEDAVSTLRKNEITPDMVVHLSQHSPLGRILATGLKQYITGQQLDERALETDIEKTGRAVAQDLERYMTPLGTIAAVAPLMGLFGTVIGMIELFAAGGTANPQQMATGISIALYNTALGLIVAIPSLIFWRHLRRKIDEYLLELEQISARFSNILLASSKQRF